MSELLEKSSVYLETTVISYLAARLSVNLVTAAHQQVTHEWWEHRRHDFLVYVSELVHQESSAGDPAAVGRRREFLAGLPLLSLTPSVKDLASLLLQRRAVPQAAAADAVHIAIAAANGVDYLVTWNLRHIANAQIRGRIDEVCLELGYAAPVICTPEELLQVPEP